MNAQAIIDSVVTLVRPLDYHAAMRFQETIQLPVQCDEALAVRMLNRYWRDVLMGLAIDTHEARSYLVDDCPLHEWLGLFERGVLPVLRFSKIQCPSIYGYISA